MESENKLILVYYISITKINSNEIDEFMAKVMEKIKSNSLDVGEIIIIPIMGETRIECINPQYVTEKSLIRKNKLLMDQLYERLDTYIKETKNG